MNDEERIKFAQDKILGVKAGELEEGDLFWLYESGHFVELGINQDRPLQVKDKTTKGIYFELPHCGGSYPASVNVDEIVLKAPSQFRLIGEAARRWYAKEITDEEFAALREEACKKEQEVLSDKYWLKKADELGIGKTENVPMTKAAKKRHIKEAGQKCPYCKVDVEDNVDYGKLEPVENGNIEQKCNCKKCERRWIDVFRLADVHEGDW